jgi:RNA polymerase sigma factor (sigma-70 family)
MAYNSGMNAVDSAELVVAYWPLACRIGNRWKESYPHLRDDIESGVGYLLFQAATKYPPDCPFSFPVFARRQIGWGLIRWLKREKRTNPLGFHQQPLIVNDEGKLLDPVTTIQAPEAVDRLELAELIEVARQAGKELNWSLLERYTLDDATMEELAASLGVSAARVGQRIARAVKSAKEAIGQI